MSYQPNAMSYQPSAMHHQLTKLLLLTFLLLTITQTANAYWLESTPEPFSLREREHALPSKEKMFFTIQDNFAFFTEGGATAPLLLPNTDYFVPADIVPINIPVFGTFSHPAEQLADPLANILYANLKIKKLLAEYADIQKRAQLLLDEEPAAFPSEKMYAAQPFSVEQNLEQIYFSLSSVDETLITETENDQKSKESTDDTEKKESLLAFHHLNQKISGQQIPSGNSAAASEKIGKVETQAIANQSDTTYSNKFAPSTVPSQSGTYQDSITLPWILELPFKIFSYLLEHKITALVIGFLSLMLFNFIFGSRT
jgi:hypothetical protein